MVKDSVALSLPIKHVFDEFIHLPAQISWLKQLSLFFGVYGIRFVFRKEWVLPVNACIIR